MKNNFKLMALCLIAAFSQLGHAQKINNSHDYLSMISEHGSSGAGNGGGNPIVSQIFEEGYVGLNLLLISQKITEEEAKRIRDAIRLARVFPVDFNLCQNDKVSDCDESTTYALKNYPDKNVILVDARNLPNRWINKTILDKRRVAVHEFAGLAGIEIANHSVSVLIDDDRTLNQLRTKKELKNYFQLLNDLYFTLPGVEEETYMGHWKMDTMLRPLSLKFITNKEDILIADNSWISISGRWSNGDLSFRSWSSNVINDEPICGFSGKVKKGEFYCDDAYFPELAFKKWSGRTKLAFAPSFKTPHLKAISSFSCKALSEDRLMCRMISEDESTVPMYLLSTLIEFNMHQYVFYTRQVKLDPKLPQ